MNTIIILTDIVEKMILLTLFGLSIWSISIIIDRRKTLTKEIDVHSFEKLLKDLHDQNIDQFKVNLAKQSGFLQAAMKSALEHPKTSETIDRAVASFVKNDRQRLEKGLSVLATLGANAPFIGLFGTVLGIIRSFAYLGSQSGSSAVMSGVSQALYATAMGLFVAIPAVIAFNVYTQKIKQLLSWTESLRDLLIAKIQSR